MTEILHFQAVDPLTQGTDPSVHSDVQETGSESTIIFHEN